MFFFCPSLTRLAVPALLALLSTGCSEVKVWPFDSSSTASRSGAPANATEYQCDGGKRFYVRMLDNGSIAWVILPDREVGLSKSTSGSGTRYTNGIAVLDISNAGTTLNDGPKIAYSGCKTTGK